MATALVPSPVPPLVNTDRSLSLVARQASPSQDQRPASPEKGAPSCILGIALLALECVLLESTLFTWVLFEEPRRPPPFVLVLCGLLPRRKRYLVYELMTGGDIYDRLLKSRRRENAVPFHWPGAYPSGRDPSEVSLATSGQAPETAGKGRPGRSSTSSGADVRLS